MPLIEFGGDPWHEVGATGEPAFASGWANTGPTAAAAFRKDSAGNVQIKGQVTKNITGVGGANAIFTLPSGYRPRHTHHFITSKSTIPSSIAEVQIGGDGTVSYIAVAAEGVVYIYLNIIFPSEV